MKDNTVYAHDAMANVLDFSFCPFFFPSMNEFHNSFQERKGVPGSSHRPVNDCFGLWDRCIRKCWPECSFPCHSHPALAAVWISPLEDKRCLWQVQEWREDSQNSNAWEPKAKELRVPVQPELYRTQCVCGKERGGVIESLVQADIIQVHSHKANTRIAQGQHEN